MAFTITMGTPLRRMSRIGNDDNYPDFVSPQYVASLCTWIATLDMEIVCNRCVVLIEGNSTLMSVLASSPVLSSLYRCIHTAVRYPFQKHICRPLHEPSTSLLETVARFTEATRLCQQTPSLSRHSSRNQFSPKAHPGSETPKLEAQRSYTNTSIEKKSPNESVPTWPVAVWPSMAISNGYANKGFKHK